MRIDGERAEERDQHEHDRGDHPETAVVDIGAKVTNIVVHEGGVPKFVLALLLGGDDVTSAVVDGPSDRTRSRSSSWSRI